MRPHPAAHTHQPTPRKYPRLPPPLRDLKDMITPQFRELILLFLSSQEVRYAINATLNRTPAVPLNRSVKWQKVHVLEIMSFVRFTRKNHLETVPFISIQDTARPSVGGLIRHTRQEDIRRQNIAYCAAMATCVITTLQTLAILNPKQDEWNTGR